MTRKKVKRKGDEFIVKNEFSTSKNKYQKGDKISLSSDKQIKYLQSINVI